MSIAATLIATVAGAIGVTAFGWPYRSPEQATSQAAPMSTIVGKVPAAAIGATATINAPSRELVSRDLGRKRRPASLAAFYPRQRRGARGAGTILAPHQHDECFGKFRLGLEGGDEGVFRVHYDVVHLALVLEANGEFHRRSPL